MFFFMRSLVVAVMMVSGGLALVARCFEAGNDGLWAVPSLLFFAGVACASVGTYLFARTATRRSRAGVGTGASDPSAYRTFDAWSGYVSSNDGGHPARERSGQRDDLFGFSLSRAQVKEAARMLMFAGEEEMEKMARARTAGRSACRRGRGRRVQAPQPKRRRVRPRARLFM